MTTLPKGLEEILSALDKSMEAFMEPWNRFSLREQTPAVLEFVLQLAARHRVLPEEIREIIGWDEEHLTVLCFRSKNKPLHDTMYAVIVLCDQSKGIYVSELGWTDHPSSADEFRKFLREELDKVGT